MTARCVSFALTGLVALGMVAAQPAKAALISFVEDPLESAPNKVTTDLSGGTIASTLGNASISFGNVSGASSFLLNIALIQPGTESQTGGGKGVSDILELLSFVSNGAVVGLEAIYLSDMGGPGLPNPGFPAHPTYCSTTPGDGAVCAAGVPNSEFKKTGGLLAFFPSAALPGTSDAIPLEIDVTSPLQGVPEPAALVLFMSGLALFGAATRFGRRGN